MYRRVAVPQQRGRADPCAGDLHDCRSRHRDPRRSAPVHRHPDQHGETAYSNATLTASLADLVDDASFDGLVTASTGTASYAAPNLSWSGSIPLGDTVTISLTVTVAGQPAGNRQLVITAVSAAPGSSCPAGASNTSCTASVTVLLPKLSIAKSADRATTVPGGVVGYTIVITNDGETAQTGVTVTDSLAGVLPDAAYSGDAVVTGGGVLSYSAPNLAWTGSLPIGASATISYSVTVHSPDPGDKILNNSVVSAAPGSICPAGSTAATCHRRSGADSGAGGQQDGERCDCGGRWGRPVHDRRGQHGPDLVPAGDG
jgi:large repetitive protein